VPSERWRGGLDDAEEADDWPDRTTKSGKAFVLCEQGSLATRSPGIETAPGRATVSLEASYISASGVARVSAHPSRRPSISSS
jgi:hypothetical protein